MRTHSGFRLDFWPFHVKSTEAWHFTSMLHALRSGQLIRVSISLTAVVLDLCATNLIKSANVCLLPALLFLRVLLHVYRRKSFVRFVRPKALVELWIA